MHLDGWNLEGGCQRLIKYGDESVKMPFEFWWCPFFYWSSNRLRIQEAPHVNNDSTPVIFPLFMEVIQLLVEETNE
jgi:hypothetical protein